MNTKLIEKKKHKKWSQTVKIINVAANCLRLIKFVTQSGMLNQQDRAVNNHPHLTADCFRSFTNNCVNNLETPHDVTMYICGP